MSSGLVVFPAVGMMYPDLAMGFPINSCGVNRELVIASESLNLLHLPCVLGDTNTLSLPWSRNQDS